MSLTEVLSDGTYKNIMNDIKQIFLKKKINFTASQSEIVIEGSNKKKVCALIGSLPIPKQQLPLLLDVVEVKNKVFIRRRFK